MNDVDPALEEELRATQARLAALKDEHKDLDAAVEALTHTARPDMILLARLKKRKLILRDQITQLEDQVTPDIIA